MEFDVWLSKDDKIVVVHGGDNGEFSKRINNPSK